MRAASLFFLIAVGCSRTGLDQPPGSGIGEPLDGGPDPSFENRPRAVRVATSGNDAITAIGSDVRGNVYFVALRGDATDFTLTVIGRDGSTRDEHCPTNDPSSRVMAAKLSANGECVWAHYFEQNSVGTPAVVMGVSPEGVVLVSTGSWWETMPWIALGDHGQTLWTKTLVGPFVRPNPLGGFVLFGHDATNSGKVIDIDAAGNERWSAQFDFDAADELLTGFDVDDQGRPLVAGEVSNGVWSPTGHASDDLDAHGKTLSFVSVYTNGNATTSIAREESAISTDPALEEVSDVAGSAGTTYVVAFAADRSAELVALAGGTSSLSVATTTASLPYGVVAHPNGTVALGILDGSPPSVTEVRVFDASLTPVSSVSITPAAAGRVMLDSIATLPESGTLVGGWFQVGAADASFTIDALGGDDGLLVWID
jgi:hypothetical protein